MVPPDALYLQNYVDAATHDTLLNLIDQGEWRSDLKRRVQHHGFRYDYRARRVPKESYLGPLPDWLDRIAQRLWKDALFDRPPDQVIINEYLPGQGIAPHVDCEPCFGHTIASLSLGAPCSMQFSHLHSETSCSQRLAARSLLVLEGQARFDWTHGIAARKSDHIDGKKIARERQVSLTFRTVMAT